jgi:hypothetical protein
VLFGLGFGISEDLALADFGGINEDSGVVNFGAGFGIGKDLMLVDFGSIWVTLGLDLGPDGVSTLEIGRAVGVAFGSRAAAPSVSAASNSARRR